ncbi:hypothetical protein OHD16_26010 [Sphingobacterium sp. ML3W]|uniref:hypothetical protein n=1 Tax=Sphingobacterium sp. ML3W TaxID=1538644 RepID=UPI00249C04FA|nr:hypothetical protein [Sphingobacterium sp. ML3W]WFA78161.1 hypothetical protein OGI71_19150 [Sphingobacterium sp. ML3W]
MNKVVKRIIGTMSIGVMTLGISMGANAQSIKNEKEVKADKEVKASKETKLVLANQTWYFTGSSSDNPTTPSLYTTTPHSDGCPTPLQRICTIEAPDNGSGQPDMSAPVLPGKTVADQINDAKDSLNTSSPQTNETVSSFRKN